MECERRKKEMQQLRQHGKFATIFPTVRHVSNAQTIKQKRKKKTNKQRSIGDLADVDVEKIKESERKSEVTARETQAKHRTDQSEETKAKRQG